ncbi:hypothetical protein AGABI2DRAFT_119293 [Agaricus bisporus var. bisporus H97]|uniref:hypothetical protein n=1 Tax=Agaricus bisporus var. bisporus (strain H97 / ATCC MYA-4626 / FGSC 10389) TaxID=936046 RepID=UPI00029F7956|nr:hypothetical protein AGABI2DRAFT_119293 [Agaricus bisporus var. bisporus H97]EKV45616.1 hypothetical protein AGABI2DRAFT_119293 [Agaricus bisporus var. bisporus H97]
MTWPIHLNRSVLIRKRIQSSKAEVLKILSDGESYLSLQPYVKEMSRNTSNPQEFRVTEQVPAPLGLWTHQNSFSITFVPAEDDEGQGMNMTGVFDMSFFCPKFKSSVRVKETEEPGTVEIVEKTEMQPFCLMSPYIMGLFEEAHMTLLENLAEGGERRAEVGE